MNFIFVIQGEGRGHLTQAIALNSILQKNGHNIAKIIVGISKYRQLPQFFLDKFAGKIETVQSPNFIKDKQNRKLKIFKSIFCNLLQTFTFVKSVAKISKIVKETNPDAIINFYEPLLGIYSLFYRKKPKIVVIGHHLIYSHPSIILPNNYPFQKLFLKLLNKITTIAADKKLALSFYQIENCHKKKIIIVPPLLRQELFNLQIKNEEFLLVYLLNDGYSKYIIEWSNKNKHINIFCFYDKKDAPQEYKYSDNLTFCLPDDVKFLGKMSCCKAVVSSAGFETICEAMYLQKPVMMVPTENHFEQYCNAMDGQKAKAGIYSKNYDIDKLLNYANRNTTYYDIYHKWIEQAENIFIKELESL